ncbi:MAG: GNAT family N-acetyltransferase [Pirellulales bacterium]|nr:GNAT family N-acetyltransferase [Pirellulales bacterium]
MIPRLETARLVMREFVEADLDGYAGILADEEAMRYIGDGTTADRNDAWRSMAMVLGHWQLRGFGLWAVERKDTGRFIGRIGLHRPEGWPGLEAGWIVAREHWGQGFAPEAARAAVQWGFEVLGAPRLISLIRPANHASIRVAEKLGMQFDRSLPFRGREVSVYGLSASNDTPGS